VPASEITEPPGRLPTSPLVLEKGPESCGRLVIGRSTQSFGLGGSVSDEIIFGATNRGDFNAGPDDDYLKNH